MPIPSLFVSFVPSDADFVTELEAHLASLIQEKAMTLWHPGLIAPGTSITAETETHLAEASIVLVMLSPAYIASPLPASSAMGQVLLPNARENASILPILVRDCDIETTPFADMLILPRNGRSLEDLRSRNSAYRQIAAEIRTLAQKLQRVPQKTSPVISEPVVSTLPSKHLMTFLMTDIEGSSDHWARNDRGMSRAMLRHDELAGRIIEEYGGSLPKGGSEGDSLFGVFALPSDAVQAAYRIQQEFAQEPWPLATPLRVRIAIYTGQAAAYGNDFRGDSVNRCSRIRDAGHGGQILVSRSTYDLVYRDPPEDVTFADLGEQTLRGMKEPEQVFQLLHPDLTRRFPPLRTEGPQPYEPVDWDPLIGRDTDLEKIWKALQTNRLVTLFGPAGCGKSRLAAEIYRRWKNPEDGSAERWARFIRFDVDTEPVLTLANELRASAQQRPTLREAIAATINTQELLLVFNNSDGRIQACTELVTYLLGVCPRLRILVTTQAKLQMPTGLHYRVALLAYPVSPYVLSVEELVKFSAVEFFLQRAIRHDPDFALTPQTAEAVQTICQTLDGLPLALDIAASWIEALGVDMLANRLLEIVMQDASSTSSMRASLNVSYELLDSEQKRLFCYLSVFRDGASLEAIEAVCAATQEEKKKIVFSLRDLVNRSLIVAETLHGPQMRYRLLHVVQTYGQTYQSESDVPPAYYLRHAEYYAKFVEDIESRLHRDQQQQALDLLDMERSNVRAALDWCWAHPEGIEYGIRLVGAAATFWSIRGQGDTQWLRKTREQLKANLSTHSDPAVANSYRAKALLGTGSLALRQGDLKSASEDWQQSLELYQTIQDAIGEATISYNLGNLERVRSNYAEARQLYERSLSFFEQQQQMWHVAQVRSLLGQLSYRQSEYAVALDHSQKALSLSKKLGDMQGVAVCLNTLGNIACRQGEQVVAQQYQSQSLAIARELRFELGIAQALHGLSYVARANGELERARKLCEESLDLLRKQGEPWGIAYVLNSLGNIARGVGEEKQARDLHEESLRIFEQLQDRRGSAYALNNLGLLDLSDKRLSRAEECLRQSLEQFRFVKDRRGITNVIENFARLALQRQEWQRALILQTLAARFYKQLGLKISEPLPGKYFLDGRVLEAKLSPDQFKWIVERCEQMTLEQAIQYALHSIGIDLIIGEVKSLQQIQIVHISDLHAQEENRLELEWRTEALLADLAILEIQPDRVLFTGDLAFSGRPEEYALAQTLLLDPLIKQLGIERSQLLVIPGNKDVDSSLTDSYTEAGLALRLTDSDKAAEAMRHPTHGQGRLKGYGDYVRNYFGLEPAIYRTHIIETTAGSVGFACLNSAWRCSGEEDEGRLFLTQDQVLPAARALKECLYKIALVHHPLSWLHPSEQEATVPDLIREFDVILRGHLHEPFAANRQSAATECLELACPALFDGRRPEVGYNLYTLDLETGKMTVRFRRYVRERNAFDLDTAHAQGGQAVFQLPARKSAMQ